jgi:hypothetical protein
MDIEQRIRELAYHLWIEEGRPHGREDEHWKRAMSQVAGNAAADRGAPKRRARKAATPGLAKPERTKSLPAKPSPEKTASAAKRVSGARTRASSKTSS